MAKYMKTEEGYKGIDEVLNLPYSVNEDNNAIFKNDVKVTNVELIINELAKDKEIISEDEWDTLLFSSTISLSTAKTYDVIFDNNEYLGLKANFHEYVGTYIGNLALYSGNTSDNTGEDFLLYSWGTYVHLRTYGGTHTISVTERYEDKTSTMVGKTIGELNNQVTKNTSDIEELKEYSVQSDFTQEDNTAKDYIKNKPRIGLDYIILTDSEDGLDYKIQMKDGNITSTRLIPKGIKIVSLPNKTTYYQGEIIDLTGLEVVLAYEHGDTITDKYTHSASAPFDAAGEIEVILTVSLSEFTVTTSFTLNILEFDPETVLIDFNYTENDDGTYTLTGWKQTLNGETSTELIIPKNTLIKV